MKVFTTDSISCIIYIEETDFADLKISPDSFSAENALDFLRDKHIFTCAGEEKAKVELYPGDREAIVFVRLCQSEPVMLTFGSLEALKQAVNFIDDEQISRVLWYSEKYVIILYPFDKKYISAGEYGDITEPLSKGLYLHILEHGKEICTGKMFENFITCL